MLVKNGRRNILIVTGLFPTPREKSFSGIFVVDQMKELSKHYNIHIITPYLKSIKEEIVKPLPENEITDDLNIHYIKYFSLVSFIIKILKLADQKFINYLTKKFLSYKILNKATKLHSKYNFQLVHGHEVFIGDEVANIGHVLGIPSFLTIHSLLDYHKELYDKRTISMIIDNMRNVNNLITVSHLVAKSYKEYVGDKFSIIPNGYTPKPIMPLPDNIIPITKNRTVFLFAGFLIQLKRPDLIISATKTLIKMGFSNFVVLIVGIGPLETILKENISKERLNDSVYMLGEIDPKDMPSYFNCSDVILQPSVSESFSMTCLEGMAYGKPFICTSNAGISEYITNSKEGFVIEPDNVDQLVDKMRLFLNDEVLLKSMGSDAYIKSKEFDWSNISMKIIDLYNFKLNN